MFRSLFPISGIAFVLGSALPPIPDVGRLQPIPEDGPTIIQKFYIPAEAGIDEAELRSRLASFSIDDELRPYGNLVSRKGEHAFCLWVPCARSRDERLAAVRARLKIDAIVLCPQRTR